MVRLRPRSTAACLEAAVLVVKRGKRGTTKYEQRKRKRFQLQAEKVDTKVDFSAET